ncbi:hypothetical protein P3T29_006511 [Kitasatospora sp. MAP5-34]|nr:hypothetical protein [Kitasatospora sp. MAP5-34]
MGRTPVVRVRGSGSGRVSMAGMSCYKKDQRSRLIYGFRVHRGRKGEPKGFTWKDYRDLILRARIQLGGPIVLVWDNLSAHLMPPMKEFIAANQDWLTVFQLPSYAPDLNPRKPSGHWSNATSATSPSPTSTTWPRPSNDASRRSSTART